MVMSHFRPVNSTATEEEKVTVRKEKLRCKYQGFFLFFVFFSHCCLHFSLCVSQV